MTDVKTYEETVHQYPWTDGFDSMLDLTACLVSGEPVNKDRLLSALGIVKCNDGLCSGFDHNINSIRQEQRYGSIEEVDSFVLGALNALDAVTITRNAVEVTYV